MEEISDRNAEIITSELERKAEQMETALTVLNDEYLQSENTVRQFIDMIQSINNLDMFALVDEEGMVYTADSTFSGISRFNFLSKEITEREIYMTKSYGTKAMVIMAIPVVYETPANIHIVSCFTGLNIENVFSTNQLQNAEN